MKDSRIESQIEGGWVVRCAQCPHQEYFCTLGEAETALTKHLTDVHFCRMEFRDLPCTYFEDRSVDDILDAEIIG